MAKSKDSTVVATPAKENKSSSVTAKKTEENKNTAANNNKSEEKPKKDSVASKSPKDETPKLKEKKPKAKETSAPVDNKETPKAKEVPKAKEAPKKKVVAPKSKDVAADASATAAAPAKETSSKKGKGKKANEEAAPMEDATAESMQDDVPSKKDKKRKLEGSASQAPRTKVAKIDDSATPSAPSARVALKNMPANTNEENVKDFFKDCGIIDDLYLIQDRFKQTFKGNAYATFDSIEAAEKAVAKSGQNFLGSKIVVEAAAPRPFQKPAGSTIFMARVADGVTDDAVREFFKDCGDVVYIHWIKDKFTGVFSGCGYIGFSNEQATTLAAAKNGTSFLGQSVCVDLNGPRGKQHLGVFKCYKCGQTGHYSRKCPDTKAVVKCFVCGDEGHYSRDCPSSTETSASWGCFKCGESGHISRKCPQMKALVAAGRSKGAKKN